MKVYLANRMTGKRGCNFAWFDAAAADLRERGYEVVSPAEIDREDVREQARASKNCRESYATGETWGDFLARDVKLIADSGIDAVVVGPEWRQSKGARLETFIAFLVGLPVLDFDTMAPVPLEILAEAWVDRRLETVFLVPA